MPPSEPPRNRPAIEIAALRDLAIDLAREAGQLALHGRRSAEIGPRSHKSSPTDLVTEFDRAAERLLLERIQRARPHDAVIGEEGTQFIGSSGLTWLLDPIDGTTNFVYDLPAWCTSIAVRDGTRIIAGAVYAPVSDEMFAAGAGLGATLDSRPLRCSAGTELELALIATGFGYRSEIRHQQAQRVARMISSVRDIRRLGSAAIDLCHVAAGRVDAYFEEHLNAWDAAAGELIALEAGAVSSDFAGRDSRPEELLVATPGIHRALLALLQRAG